MWYQLKPYSTRTVLCGDCKYNPSTMYYRSYRGLARDVTDPMAQRISIAHLSGASCDVCDRRIPPGAPIQLITEWEDTRQPRIWESAYMKRTNVNEWERLVNQIRTATRALAGA